MFSTEWQKRGLRHIHILLWMVHRISPDMVDELIYTNPTDDSILYDIIKFLMTILCQTDDFVWQKNKFMRRKRGKIVDDWPGIMKNTL